jgi:hypothetical protein
MSISPWSMVAVYASCGHCLAVSRGPGELMGSMETYLVLDDGIRSFLAAPDHHLAATESAELVLGGVKERQVGPVGGEVADEHDRIVRVTALRVEEGLPCGKQLHVGRKAVRRGGRKRRRRRRRRRRGGGGGGR